MNIPEWQKGLDIMVNRVSLSVNNIPITLDFFVHEYVEKIVGGIVASLKDTGKIDSLELSIDNRGQVAIYLNSAEVSLKEFPMQIIKGTVEGMVASLKGVEAVINSVEIKIGS